jgi:hypothetical protein
MGGAIAPLAPADSFDADALRKIAGESFDEAIFERHAKLSSSGKRVVAFEDLVKLGFAVKGGAGDDCDQSARTLASELTARVPEAAEPAIEDIKGVEQPAEHSEAPSPSAPGVPGVPSRSARVSRQNTGKSGISLVFGKKTHVCAEGHALQIIFSGSPEAAQFTAAATEGLVCGLCSEDDLVDCPFYFCSTCSQMQCHYCAVGGGAEPDDLSGHGRFDDSESPQCGGDDLSEN